MRYTTPLRLLAVMTVLVLCFSALFVAAGDDSAAQTDEHQCGYEQLVQYHNATPTSITLTHEDPETGAVVYEGVSRSSSGTYAPIRIGVFFDDLDYTSKHCTSAKGTAPNFQGGKIACSEDTVLTEQKKNTLRNVLIPAALQLHMDRLKVDPLSSPIKPDVAAHSICSNFAIPSSHYTNGVSGYDFVLYVSAAPTSGNTIAWATTCNFLEGPNGEVGRPVVGVTNISPKYIAKSGSAVRAVAHETMHALGFDSWNFQTAGMSTTATVRQKTGVPVITSSKVVSAAKEHYGCNSLTNMEIEDRGGSGTAGHHWKRRNAKDELMSGSSSHAFYTALSIAAMEDLGYYQGDYSKAEVMSWGKNVGCKLSTDMCMTNSVSLDESMFCMDGDFICTSDRDAVGMCYTTSASLPSWASNYGLFNNVDTMDYCPFVKAVAGGKCFDGSTKTVPDSKFGALSRCLDTSSGSAVCASVMCGKSTYTVQFKSGDSIACTPGDKVKIPKTKRSATCPPYREVCDGECTGACQSVSASAMMPTARSSMLLVLLAVLLSLLA